jgi:hypothetical protein
MYVIIAFCDYGSAMLLLLSHTCYLECQKKKVCAKAFVTHFWGSVQNKIWGP